MDTGYRVADPPGLCVQLRVPKITKEYIRYKLQLPERFLGSCTLKEGTCVTLLILQIVAVLFISVTAVLYLFYFDDMDYYWKMKFREDFDPYREKESQELINSLWPLWDDIALILIGLHAAYFVTGLGVVYGLCNKNAHPFWYLPWLLLTGFMVLSNFGTGTAMLIYLFVVAGYRDITVTWDWVPLIMVYIYGVCWFYGFATAVAHYRRRRIVKYWKDSQRKLGNTDY